ncbi:MAG: prepilin-type N-terminal cleavage/methylation domain-containing protein [Candidatus Berkelbacteria bacterium]
MNLYKRAFTLIELMIVIAIIGILAGIVVYSASGAQAKVRDNTRKADIDQISTALEMYKQANGTYPKLDTISAGDFYGTGVGEYQYIQGEKTLGSNGTDHTLYDSLSKYLSPVPVDQRDKNATSNDWKLKYIYKPMSSTFYTTYLLFTVLETGSGGNSPNGKCYYAGQPNSVPLDNLPLWKTATCQ